MLDLGLAELLLFGCVVFNRLAVGTSADVRVPLARRSGQVVCRDLFERLFVGLDPGDEHPVVWDGVDAVEFVGVTRDARKTNLPWSNSLDFGRLDLYGSIRVGQLVKRPRFVDR